MASSKPFDLVVFGATGFTGALVARYLLQEPESSSAPNALRWALAARSQNKLDAVKEELKQKLPDVAAAAIDAVPTLLADSGDESSLVAMVQQTRVVLSVVGPYKLYGSLLVKACAENGVHYCDLTGEILWVEEMVTKYQAAAQRTGAVLVNCCGFESIPSDLTAFLVADKIRESRGPGDKDVGTAKIDLYFTKIKGAASGGTLASVFTVMDTASSRDLKRSRHPFFLTDERTRAEKEAAQLVKPNSTSVKVEFDSFLKRWSSLFLGGSVNQAIVHRSNFLLGGRYGDRFVYRERMSASTGFWANLVATAGFVLLGVLIYFRLTRWVLKRVAPAPGQGPSEELMRKGFFVAESVGYAAADDGKPAVRARTVGSGDPGYALTCRLISECAFCLAKGELHSADVGRGGFYTPASAFGHHIATRLDSKKFITFKVESL